MMLDTSTNAWSIVFANEAWEKLVGRTCTPGTQLPFWDIFQVERCDRAIHSRERHILLVLHDMQHSPLHDDVVGGAAAVDVHWSCMHDRLH
jgi:PAS domain-containing protein